VLTDIGGGPDDTQSMIQPCVGDTERRRRTVAPEAVRANRAPAEEARPCKGGALKAAAVPAGPCAPGLGRTRAAVSHFPSRGRLRDAGRARGVG
jgi:hypothetical protein